MSDSSTRLRASRSGFVLAVAAVLLTHSLAAGDGRGDRPVSWEPRVPLGKSLAPANTLLCNEDPERGWRTIGGDEAIHSRDMILALPGVRGKLLAGSVELTLWGNLPELSPFPGLQSAVILHDSRAFSLDVTVMRGRVVLTNRKSKGSVDIWLRVEGGAVDLSLEEPGDSVAVETYGQWPATSHFRKGDEEHRPMRSVDFVMLKGEMQIRASSNRFRLSAPPGPAFFHWDSVNGPDEGPLRRDALPPWADRQARPPQQAELVADAARQLRGRLEESSPSAALAELLAGARRGPEANRARLLREMAVLGLAALNDLDPVIEALEGKEADARTAAVVALQHWIGEAAGRDQQLYRRLAQRRGFSPAQAETVLQLLHNPFDAREPDTYEILISYLGHRQQAVRELASWHLRRLVPEGRKIPYDASASEAERKRAAADWQQLIPAGTVPGKSK